MQDEEQTYHQMLSRTIKFQRVKKYVVEDIISECAQLKKIQNKYLLPLHGVCFNESSSQLHILMP